MATALSAFVGQPDPHRPRFPPPPLLSPALESKKQNKINALSILERQIVTVKSIQNTELQGMFQKGEILQTDKTEKLLNHVNK